MELGSAACSHANFTSTARIVRETILLLSSSHPPALFFPPPPPPRVYTHQGIKARLARGPLYQGEKTKLLQNTRAHGRVSASK